MIVILLGLRHLYGRDVGVEARASYTVRTFLLKTIKDVSYLILIKKNKASTKEE